MLLIVFTSKLLILFTSFLFILIFSSSTRVAVNATNLVANDMATL